MRRPLNILLTADPYLPVPPPLYGGIERIVYGLAQEYAQLGHRVGLVAHPESAKEFEFFCPWPGQDQRGAGNWARHALALQQAIGAFRPDVLHSFSRLVLLLPHLLRRMPKIMSYQRHTGGWRNSIAAAMGRNFVFTGCSEYIAAQGRPHGGRWLGIPNFVDVDYYRYSASVANDAPLVFLSRLEAIKGAHTAIRIARHAGRRLIIAGNKVDTPEGRDYWSREIEPNLSDGLVEYIGAVNDEQKNDLLGRAAAMLVPIEWHEPFGIVFAEALACGTPVIACPFGALPEIVEHGRHGFLVNSVEEGVDAVRRLGTIARAACRKRAEERFSRRVVGAAYLSLYEEMIGHVE